MAANQAIKPAATRPSRAVIDRAGLREGERMVPVPLGPTLHPAPIGDADQGPVVEVPPQVLRERGRAGIAPMGFPRQGTREDRGQTRADPMVRPTQSGGDRDSFRRPFVGESDVQHHRQRVDVRPGVDGRGGPPLGQRHQGVKLLGSDERGRAPDPGRLRPAGTQGRLCQVEVEQQGHAVRRQEDVRRLDIPVDEIPEMRVVERLRQAQADPSDRPFVGLRGQELTRGSRGRERDRGRARGPVEHLHQVPPGSFGRRAARQLIQQVLERHASQVGEAEDPQALFGEVLRGQDRHDMRVLEPGQQPMLAPLERADLEDDRPVRQIGLRRQVDRPLGPAPQHGQQAKTGQLVPEARVGR